MSESAGYVTFEVGDTSFALSVTAVSEVLRSTDVQLLPSSDRRLVGRSLMLADARGRALPVLDLRTDPMAPSDVLLARQPGYAGLVVDRVTAVLRPGQLQAEDLSSPALPSYAVGVLRPVGGGVPVLLVQLPEVPEPGDVAYEPTAEPALGEPVLEPALAH